MGEGVRRRLLVIEDDAPTRDALTEALTAAGFEVQAAQHGAEALALLEGGFTPDALLMDLSMPVMSGPELHRALQARPEWAAIPVVIVTANAHDAAPLAVEAVLSKPFDMGQLLGLVRRLTAEPAAASAHRRVLVVEDEADIREAISELLQLSGFAVQQAADGQEALQQLHEGRVPELIVTDLLMPRLNGWDLLQELKRHPDWSEIPVVVVSAASPSTATRVPVEAVLAKPVQRGELVSSVARACERAAARRRQRQGG